MGDTHNCWTLNMEIAFPFVTRYICEHWSSLEALFAPVDQMCVIWLKRFVFVFKVTVQFLHFFTNLNMKKCSIEDEHFFIIVQ